MPTGGYERSTQRQYSNSRDIEEEFHKLQYIVLKTGGWRCFYMLSTNPGHNFIHYFISCAREFHVDSQISFVHIIPIFHTSAQILLLIFPGYESQKLIPYSIQILRYALFLCWIIKVENPMLQATLSQTDRNLGPKICMYECISICIWASRLE